MKNKIFAVLLIGLVLASVGCTQYELVGQVDATVVNKTYKPATTIIRPVPMLIGKHLYLMSQPIRQPAQYLVELQYEDVAVTIDDKELYKNVGIGDVVKVNYYKAGEKEKIVFEGEIIPE